MSLFATNPAADKALRDLIEAGVADGSIRMEKYPPEPPRYDEALLQIQLSNMPLGKYHTTDLGPNTLFRNGEVVATILCPGIDSPEGEGLVAALVHLLNAREQTEIANGTKP